MCISYVDDILFWAKYKSDIIELGIKLCAQGLLLEQEDDAECFLGVFLNKNAARLIEMKQTGLIICVIETLGLDVCMSNPKWKPAEGTPLVCDQDGEYTYGDFSYSSVVGMLLYVSRHTRPDVLYAMNCCVRYMFNSRRSCDITLK